MQDLLKHRGMLFSETYNNCKMVQTAHHFHKHWLPFLVTIALVSLGLNPSQNSDLFPPELKKGDWQKHIIFNSSEVFALKKYSVRFKINPQHRLDSLAFSDKTPVVFKDSVTNQLTRLNGQWTTHSANRWLIFNFYDFGVEDYSGRSGKIPINVHVDYQTLSRELKQDNALFGPGSNTTKARYIRTEEGYLFKPIVVSRVL